MPTKRSTPLRSIVGIGPGAVATQRLPIGSRFHKAVIGHMALGKTFFQNIKEIRAVVNGVPQRTFTPKELDDLNKANGAEYAFTDNGAGEWSYLTVFFREPWRKDPEVADGLAWRSRGLDTFYLEFELADDAPTTTKIVTQVDADSSILTDKEGRELAVQMQNIVKVDRKQVTLDGTKVTQFDLESGNFIQVVRFYDKYINRVKFTLNGFVVFDRTKEVNAKMLKDEGIIVDPDTFPIVFDADDPLGSSLPIAKNDTQEWEIFVDEEDEDEEDSEFSRICQIIVEKIGAPN